MHKVTKYGHERKIKLSQVAKEYNLKIRHLHDLKNSNPKLVKSLIDCLVRDREKK